MIITQISNNGLWGVTETASSTDGDIRPVGGSIVNMLTMESTSVSHGSGLSGVSDVSDDGKIVVGECNTLPGYFSLDAGRWTTLPVPSGYSTGRLNAVTPDGKYAVGYVSPSTDPYQAFPVMYDLTTRKRIDLPNLPVYDMSHEDKKQNVLYGISNDGRYILGQVSQSYLMPRAMFCYVYDRENESYNVIGFTESMRGEWRPDIANVYFCDMPMMSPDGHWVTGSAYMVKEIAGSTWPSEYNVAFRYNVLTDEFEIFDNSGDSDTSGRVISDDGTLFSATPAVNPYSSMLVRDGEYYYSLSEILRQAYGINFTEQSGFEVTGKPIAVSSDGLTLVMLPNTTETYVLRLQEPLTEAIKSVDLLANYTIEPKPEATLTAIEVVKINFDRNVAVTGNPANVELRDENGKKLRGPATNGFRAEGQTVTIGFRTTEIPEGKRYSVYVPAGMITIDGDPKVTNKPIEIFFNGRGSAAVMMTSAYPADGAAIATLDLTTNPVLLTFNADVKLLNNTTLAKLYREGENDPFCDFYLAANNNQVLLYPLAAQNLFKDTEYRLEIPEGVITDLSGYGANEKIVLHYSGTYVRQISSDDRYLFSDQCDNYNQFMFYEGDHLTPDAVASAWGFTADSTPWAIVRESESSTDNALASHSMYTPAGQADDWLVIPQLFIPDADCYLAFQSQSYLRDKQDRLKVYVYESDDVYNTLNASIVNDIRSKGVLVYDRIQTPGDEEETFSGDWTDNLVKLDRWAGKNIYIAFVNDNNDQSAVIIDNIQVVHDMKYFTSFSNLDRVVNQNEIEIRGNLTIQSDINTYNNVSMTLKDADGKVVDEINEGGLSLKKDDVYSFSFPTPLPLVRGAVNNFTVEIALDEDNTTVNSSIRNLTFQPSKKVVLEEYSGADCSNCPQGFRAIDNINTLHPDVLLPIVLRTYGGDTELAVGLSGYDDFLGLRSVGAPSARINRGNPAYPMLRVDNDYRFTGAGVLNELTGRDEECWLDLVRQEIATAADASIGLTSAMDAEQNNINLVVSVKPALDLTKQSLNLFAVVVEDGLETYQANGFSSVHSDALGEWGADGIYGGQTYVVLDINHVARATAGATYNGTGGLIPSDLKADRVYSANMSVALPQSIKDKSKCHVIVMMIDAATNRVVNANVAPLNGSSAGIDDINADADGDAVKVVSLGNRVDAVAADGEAVTLTAYNVAGAAVASAAGNGSATLDLDGFQGVMLVKAATAKGSKVIKVVVR